MTPSIASPAVAIGAGRGPAWALGVKRWCLAGALVLTAVVGVLDYVTGYDVRLDSLYLVPVAVAAWQAGRAAGFALAGAAAACWLASFHATHGQARPLLFYWDGVVLVAILTVFAELIARLRTALARADERFVRVLEEMHAAAFVVERDSERVLFANRRMLQMFGAGREQLPGRVLDWCSRPANRAGGGHGSNGEADVVWTAFRSEECRDPATGRWYLVQAGPIPWSTRRSAGLRVLTDITDRRHAQAMRREHQEMLRRTARLSALAETTSALAHEINQPLMAIASYCDACIRLLPADGSCPSELAQALEKSRAQAIRASGILRRMREFVRSKHTQPAFCAMNGIVVEGMDLLETRIADEAVVVELDLAQRLPPLFADRFLLVQVVVNLLENAIDAVCALAPAARRIAVTTSRDGARGIRVTVADCGNGISAAVAERLYTPFVSSKEYGLGLGLSICRSVVEVHGGRLWHGPRPGGGTVFEFVVTGVR